MIEYLAPSSSNGILFTSINLIGNDFTKLASNPVTIIPAVSSKNIVPISVTVKYECNGNQSTNLLIGFESLLGSDETSCAWAIPIGLTVGDKGIKTDSYSFAASLPANVANINNQSLVLWQSINNGTLSFTTFTVYIYYYTI